MEKKYELLKDDHKEIDGQLVYRIRATRDFMFDPNDPGHHYPGVRKGMLGGYIQSESNLSHNGDCWIGTPGAAGDTIVYGGSVVEGDGHVEGDITVKNSHITGFVDGHRTVIENSRIEENAWVHLFNDGKIIDSYIFGNAQVRYGGDITYSVISGETQIQGGKGMEIYASKINGNASVVCTGAGFEPKIYNSFLEEHTMVRENTRVLNSTVTGHGYICGDAEVRDSFISKSASIGGKAKLENTVVKEKAMIYGNAKTSKSEILGDARIYRDAVVENSVVTGNARIRGDAEVRNFRKENSFSGSVDHGIYDAEQMALSAAPKQEKTHSGNKPSISPSISTEKKYELAMDEAFCMMFGKKHYRIRALRNIPEQGITAGQIGGYVEGEKNLSQEGSCWIAHDALVSGDALVEKDAVVSWRTTIMDSAKITGKAMVTGFAVVSGNAVVGENAHVTGAAIIMDDAQVSSSAYICDDAKICGKAKIGTATVKDEAFIMDSFVWGDAHISGNAVVVNHANLHNGIKLSGYDYADGKNGIRQQDPAAKKLFHNTREYRKKKPFEKNRNTGKESKANIRK